MTITSIALTDFTVFRDAKLDLSPGINVFVGENATGKTHVMKALYAMVRAGFHLHSRIVTTSPARQLYLVFQVEDIARLCRRPRTSDTAATSSIRVEDDHGRFASAEWERVLTPGEPSEGRSFGATEMTLRSVVFLPSRESLAMFDGFIAAYQKRELAFDETYYDLAVSLSANTLRAPNPVLVAVAEELETILGGKVVLDGSRFYVRDGNGVDIEAPLLSEGMRKIATIVRLLQNGELEPGGMLFWDEPEANLNPRLVVTVANVLAVLAFHGIQIVLASHDYLLVETLAMNARKDGGPKTRFFSFTRKTDRSAVDVHGADDLDDLPNNPIRAEFLAHYDRINGLES